MSASIAPAPFRKAGDADWVKSNSIGDAFGRVFFAVCRAEKQGALPRTRFMRRQGRCQLVGCKDNGAINGGQFCAANQAAFGRMFGQAQLRDILFGRCMYQSGNQRPIRMPIKLAGQRFVGHAQKGQSRRRYWSQLERQIFLAAEDVFIGNFQKYSVAVALRPHDIQPDLRGFGVFGAQLADNQGFLPIGAAMRFGQIGQLAADIFAVGGQQILDGGLQGNVIDQFRIGMFGQNPGVCCRVEGHQFLYAQCGQAGGAFFSGSFGRHGSRR